MQNKTVQGGLVKAHINDDIHKGIIKLDGESPYKDDSC